MKNLLKLGAIAAVAASAIAISVAGPCSVSADAEESPVSVALNPVETESSDVVYKYLNAPTSVHADASGVYIADGDTVATMTSDGTFTERGISADKVMRLGECFVALNDGTLSIYYGDGSADHTAHMFTDFDIYENTVYAIGGDGLSVIPVVDNAFDEDNAACVALSSGVHGEVSAVKIAAGSNGVYLAVRSEVFKNKHDIALVDAETGALSVVVMQTDEVSALTVMPATGTVYALTRDRITGYYPASNGNGLSVKYTAHDERMNALYAYDGFIYALDTLDAIYKISADLTTFTALAASASIEDGFFDMPYGIAVKNSTLFVADTLNGRVAEYGEKLAYYDGFYNPISVTCDSRGAIYVAHDYNKISVIDEDKTFTVDGAIKSIAVNADKTLFIMTDCGLFARTPDGNIEKIADTAYKAIALGVGRDDLYALTDSAVVKFTAQTDEDGKTEYALSQYCSAQSDAFSIAVDLKGNVYFLSVSQITRYDRTSGAQKQYALTQDGKPYSLGFSCGQILLSTIGNDFIDYGNVIVADTYKHRIFTVDGSTDGLDVKLIDGDYNDPIKPGDDTPSAYNDGLIRVALHDIPVFSLPMETESDYTIAKGRKVIVAMYELPDTREYSLILIDNLRTGELIQGYVYKDALSEPLPYVAPPSDIGTVYTDATPVYKWPSINSVPARDFNAVDRGQNFDVLDFVESYRDDYNNLWYRVSLGENSEGYILASNLSMMDYEPLFIRPAYNAEIISYNGSEFAQTYALIDGKYTPLSVTLATGTKVEVIGTFDTSERYTKIKYVDKDLGTLTCYVETVYIEYNGVNIVLIIAIAVIIITVVLAAIIIGRVLYLKKKRLLSKSEDGEVSDL